MRKSVKTIPSLVATAMLLVGLTATAAFADERDFTLQNRTAYRITGFWFRVPGSTWVAMRGATIGPGRDSDVHFEHSGPCYLQFRVQVADGTYANFMDQQFDFCHLHSLALYYDPADRVFTAESE